MDVVSGNREHLLPEVYSRVARYRYKVFVERLGWTLQTRDGTEFDQFDRSDTVYVAAQDAHARIIGCSRLLPTTRPYLLADVFPHLLDGLSPPRSPLIWELSRFCAVDLSRPLPIQRRQFSSVMAIDLLRWSLACARTCGAKRLITMSPIGVERLLHRAGFHTNRAGPPIEIDGSSFFACWIEVGN